MIHGYHTAIKTHFIFFNMQFASKIAGISGLSLILAVIILGGSLIVSSSFIAKGYEKSRDVNVNRVSVEGSATREITSDSVKWSVEISHLAPTAKEATDLLMADGEALRAMLKTANVQDAEFSFQPISTRQDYPYDDYGYYGDQPNTDTSVKIRASQIVVIESKQVEEVGALAQNASISFSEGGRMLTPRSVEFYYSKQDELEKEMMREAIQDAQVQARALLGSDLGKLQTVEFPSFRLEPLQSNSSYYNSEDTSSIKKKAKSWVRVSFRVE